jgi:hypothetical protein
VVLLELLLFYFGGCGFAAGLLFALAVSRTRTRPVLIVATGIGMLVLWVGAWAMWGTGSCGPGCVRDASTLIASSPSQLVGWLVGGFVGSRLIRLRSSRP